MKKFNFLLSIFCLFAISSYAQNWSVSGTVTSISTNVGIANQTVYLTYTDSTAGIFHIDTATTDQNGDYQMNNLPAIAPGQNPQGSYRMFVYDCNGFTTVQYAYQNNATVNFSICTVACQADFQVTNNYSSPNTFSFQDMSSGNPTSWTWDFGDGNGSNLQNPTHTFATNDTFNVTLYINGPSCQSSHSIEVVADQIDCQASFDYTASSTNSLEVQFNNHSITSSPNNTTYTWTISNGPNTTATSYTVENPVHTFPHAGVFDATLTIQNGNCIDTTYMNVHVYGPAPCAAHYNAYADTNNSLMYYFSNASTGNPTSYNWDLGDGTTATTQHVLHTYAAPGIYTVTLIISGGNCQTQDTFSQNIHVFNSMSYYQVSGIVTYNNQAAPYSQVHLHDLNSGMIMYSTMTDQNGAYAFSNVVGNSYVIAAEPDSSNSLMSAYAVTYYGDVVTWGSATSITLNQNLSGQNINLQSIVQVPGPAVVSGNVGNGSKSGVSNANVYLLNANNELAAQTTTNNNGDYEFPLIHNGAYQIWVDIPGYTATPIHVTLSNGNNQSSNNNFLVDGNTIVPVTTHIQDVMTADFQRVYPNPANSLLTIEVSNVNKEILTVEIYGLSGQLILSQIIPNGASSIRMDVESLERGTYMLVLKSQSGRRHQMITKM